MKWLARFWRVLKWTIKCIWWGRKLPKPRVEEALYSRSYMRKAWSGRLRDMDRRVNSSHREWRHHLRQIERDISRAQEDGAVSFEDGLPEYIRLLRERKIMIAKRRRYRFN